MLEGLLVRTQQPRAPPFSRLITRFDTARHELRCSEHAAQAGLPCRLHPRAMPSPQPAAPPAAAEAELAALWAAYLARPDVLAAAAAPAEDPAAASFPSLSAPLGPLPALLAAMGAFVPPCVH